MVKRTIQLVTLALAAVGLGCGDGTGPNEGSFAATVSGDLALSLSGTAVFGTDEQQAQKFFVIILLRGEPGSVDLDAIAITRNDTLPPGSGTYDINPVDCDTCGDEDFAAAFVTIRPAAFGVFESQSGSFAITSASQDRLDGTFSFAATLNELFSFGDINAENIQLQGSFNARRDEIPSIGQ
ncbi:MAG: hypothetical protein GTN62_12075 [Gemmatimonadales bacterium]|nr:hypothetical protein [Gemmatimonadales bacterium]NIN12457.1 hypothetical protein [Gemmatimonadales bacterium]NIN50833.1 hypothetical protein [Gemmatimonadales bacterium]NIP08297.1 hypothetical protein [Gemmatimonadales bacterium]NIR00821.1 hypothetical protein [Gemmatimonadales bacterium]